MKVTQLHELVNTATQEVLGEQGVINEDLTNVVDVGNEIINTDNVDNYVKKLVNHIGKVAFKNRLYAGGAPSVLMDSWEYGSILEKVTAEMPNAEENSTANLKDGEDYSPDIFYQPSVSAQFFNSKITFEVPLSFTERQVKESFSNPNQLNGFISMLKTSVENTMTVKIDSLIMRTINNMTAETLRNDLYDSKNSSIDYKSSGVKAVNLLKLYNDANGSSLKKENALSDSNFIRYATYIIGLYSDRVKKMSSLFNIGGKERFTSGDFLNTVLLSDFEKASQTFLQADLQNKEMINLPAHETVPYWQGSGQNYNFLDVSSIDVKTADGNKVSADGILGIMFDREAIGVSNLDRRVTTNYNPKAEFYTNFYKFDAGYYNDMNENYIVFFIG